MQQRRSNSRAVAAASKSRSSTFRLGGRPIRTDGISLKLYDRPRSSGGIANATDATGGIGTEVLATGGSAVDGSIGGNGNLAVPGGTTSAITGLHTGGASVVPCPTTLQSSGTSTQNSRPGLRMQDIARRPGYATATSVSAVSSAASAAGGATVASSVFGARASLRVEACSLTLTLTMRDTPGSPIVTP